MQKVFWTQRAESLLHRCNPILHRCKSSFGWCKRLFGDLCSLGAKTFCTLLNTFWNFPFSVNFPGPQLPKRRAPQKTVFWCSSPESHIRLARGFSEASVLLSWVWTGLAASLGIGAHVYWLLLGTGKVFQ